MNQANIDSLAWANGVIRNAEQGQKRPPPQATELAELIADGRMLAARLFIAAKDGWSLQIQDGAAWNVLRLIEALEIAAVPAGFTRDQARSLYEAEMATRSGKSNHWGPPPDPFIDELLEEVSKPLHCAPDATCGQEGCTERDQKRYGHLEAPESFTEERTGRIVAWGQMLLAASVGLTGGILVGFHVL